VSENVQTVLGPVGVESLGKSLMHEHVLLGYPGWETDSLYHFNPDEAAAVAAKALQPCVEAGVRTVLDCTPMELGRFSGVLVDVAERTGMNIIAATGFYHGGVGLHSYWRMKEIDEIAEVLVHEIEDGFGDPVIKPGVLKVGTRTKVIVPAEEKALRAAARASRATGVPITTHTEQGDLGPEQIQIFTDEGVAPSQVIVGHLDNAAELDTVRQVLKLGAYVGFDQIGYEFRVSDERRIEYISTLVAEGYAPQLMISHDRVGQWLGRLTPFLQQFQDQVDVEGFGYLEETFVPALLKRGVTQADVDQMLVQNPIDYFSGPADGK
jgi:phosphotriesterase-related protein